MPIPLTDPLGEGAFAKLTISLILFVIRPVVFVQWLVLFRQLVLALGRAHQVDLDNTLRPLLRQSAQHSHVRAWSDRFPNLVNICHTCPRR